MIHAELSTDHRRHPRPFDPSVMSMIDKQQLLELLRKRITARLYSLRASQAQVQSGAIHEENRQEHPKDTRAIEAGYLARGLAERVESTRDMVASLATLKLRDFTEHDPVALGAVVALEEPSGDSSLYFLVPRAGGETLAQNGIEVCAVTPESPVGRALLGQFVGDEVELELPKGNVRSTIAGIH